MVTRIVFLVDCRCVLKPSLFIDGRTCAARALQMPSMHEPGTCAAVDRLSHASRKGFGPRSRWRGPGTQDLARGITRKQGKLPR